MIRRNESEGEGNDEQGGMMIGGRGRCSIPMKQCNGDRRGGRGVKGDQIVTMVGPKIFHLVSLRTDM